jgi:hypothetical protein
MFPDGFQNEHQTLIKKRLLTGDCVMLGSVGFNGLPDKITRHPRSHTGGSAD